MPEFEILLVSIDWEGPDKVRTIIPSKKFLEASNIKDNKYEYDIVMYHKEDDLYFQFAIKTKHFPKIKDNGNWKELYQIENTDYWINKGIWDKGSQGNYYHKCQSINTIGKIEIGLRDDFQKPHFITLDINSNIEDFDFQQLKNDFEGELWNLITSKSSVVNAEKIDFRFGDRIIRFPENKWIIEFVGEYDKIAKNPKRELTHTKENRRIEKVIPIAETYRKLSTVGTATLLPSKAVFENHDIYENRFACFMLHSIHLIVSENIKNTLLQIERLKNEIETLTQKITILQNPDPKVNSEEVEQQIIFQENRVNEMINYWRGKSNTLPQNTEGVYNQIRIKIKHAHHIDENTFWCSTNTTSFCLFVFPVCAMQYISEDTDFHFDAIFNQRGSVTTRAGVTYPRFVMTSARKIASVELLTEQNILNKQRSNKNILENNNWSQKSILNDNDLIKFQNERNNQVQTLSKKIEKINFQIKNIGEFNGEQSELKPLLVQRLKSTFFKKIKSKSFQGFKPSMTFIQNAAYRNALRYYKEILESEGIDIEVFDLYENVTSFGLREMPQIYELWCLVTQIKVLEESFHFEHEPKDLISLLKAIDPKKQTIAEHSKIDFKKSLAGRQVTLHYQKSIAENKRPDFILEITSNMRTINLVLDSKFKNYNYKKSIVKETEDTQKKYGGDRNYVFILHPCKDGTYNEKSVKYTNLGGERIYYGVEQQEKYPFHEYGYIELKPNFTDNLKKLISMSFEYLLDENHNAKNGTLVDPCPDSSMFCMNCGSEKFDYLDKRTHRWTMNGVSAYYYPSCKCQDCGHEAHLDYCWNCKTKLFKHGSYWDYHLESTWSIFDIRCPNCGMTVADRPQNTDF